MCAHPHATAWSLCNFTGPHLMLKMAGDKTIVTEGRNTEQRHWHTCRHTGGLGKLLNPDVLILDANRSFTMLAFKNQLL